MTVSTVRIYAGLDRELDIPVEHSELAAPDHIIDMARAQAGIPAYQMLRGEVLPR
jgi:hypothetical protein